MRKSENSSNREEERGNVKERVNDAMNMSSTKYYILGFVVMAVVTVGLMVLKHKGLMF